MFYIALAFIGVGCLGLGITVDKYPRWVSFFMCLAFLGFLGIGIAGMVARTQ